MISRAYAFSSAMKSSTIRAADTVSLTEEALQLLSLFSNFTDCEAVKAACSHELLFILGIEGNKLQVIED